MNKADKYRKLLIENIINNQTYLNNRVSININEGKGIYREIIPIDEIQILSEDTGITNYVIDLASTRINKIISEYGYIIDENEIDYSSTDFYDGYELTIPIIKENYDASEELFNEIDQIIRPNKSSHTPITKEPTTQQTPNLPIGARKEKTQNPRRVDLIIKSVFESKFNNYELSTDVGKWKAIKTIKNDGKLLITWEHKVETSMLIETLFFPKDTNKILVTVKNRSGEVFLNTYFEIYRIPTDDFLAQKFFRKTIFKLLKKYIDTNVIQLEPFSQEFIFWKTDSLNFSYSFSTPNKNKIILDLISFISTAQKPILDDFFEQNNLKHKQGYLQTLLDSAESAGIFKFTREGNEIIISRGPNYKAFLEGKIRRVA